MNQELNEGRVNQPKAEQIEEPIPAVNREIIVQSNRFQRESVQKQVQIILNTSTIVCSICFVEYPSDEMRSISMCTHLFCRTCILEHAQYNLTNFMKITCPMELCGEEMSKNSQVYEDFSEEQRIKFIKMQKHYEILKDPKLKVCKKQNCQGSINLKLEGICEACKSLHCLKCFELAHQGKCQKLLARNLELNKKYRQCRRCGQVIQKTEGCTHMTCTCGYFFCYSCGEALEGEHHCKIPDELNCMQKIRWEIEHIELWYETSCANFLRFLVLVQPEEDSHIAVQILCVLLYTIFIYPLTIIFGVIAIILCLVCFIIIFLIFIILLPFLTVCGLNMDLKIGKEMGQCTGVCIGFIIVFLLYPVFFLINLFQLVFCVILANTTNLREMCEVFGALFIGMRNLLLIPCLMLTSNEEFYSRQGNNFIIKH